MASKFNRGSRTRPNWYGKVKDATGAWRQVVIGTVSKVEAEQRLADIEKVNWRSESEDVIKTLRLLGFTPPTGVDVGQTFGELAKKWKAGLLNRNAADDRRRADLHLIPRFNRMRLEEIALPVVMAWIDDQRAGLARPEPPAAPDAKPRHGGKPKDKLSEPSIRHNLNLLSRFFSWAIERGFAGVNPVRLIPTGKRPQESPRTDKPWIHDDAIVRKVIRDLPRPVDLMFYLANQAGLRTGELGGLRLSDLGFLGEGVIRVRFSYDGPLKEDKRREGKVKWSPAPEDAAAVLKGWIAERTAAGAGPEDRVFLGPDGKPWSRVYLKVYLGRAFRAAAEKHGASAMTWYQATRHSFVSRNLANGVPLDEVSAAVGHGSTITTRRYYDHFVRKTFSPQIRKGLGMVAKDAEGADVLSLDAAKRAGGGKDGDQ